MTDFYFREGWQNIRYTDTTAYPEAHKIHSKYSTGAKKFRNTFVLALVVRLFIYHYFLICRRFKFNIFNMNMCRHSNSGNSSGAFQNCISFFFGAHKALREREREQKLKEPKESL